jgi:hypothetical protein
MYASSQFSLLQEFIGIVIRPVKDEMDSVFG